MSTRVRFAPSPTGPLHMGGVRTALFNYLFAKKHGGTMILRIEDTDQNRYVAGAEEYIMESLAWSGIKIDEGVKEGGEYGPYRQSERKEIYKEYADRLIENGWAYYAFDTAEELNAWREKDLRPKTEDQNLTEDERLKTWKFSYDTGTRKYLKNSLSMPAKEVEQLMDEGVPYVVRFMFPLDEEIVMQDLIRGEVRVNTAALDDKVLFKSDGMPTYHLANVVDDHLMKISHVIRGEEWLPSMPLHVMLYKAFGWTDTQPEFAHLPLIMKPVGKGKLSKRDGDKLGFPVFPINWKNQETGDEASGYREAGYLPEAFVNMLALLGWNPGTEQEIFSMKQLIKAFSLERVGKSGSRFDPEKSKSLNHAYIQKLGDAVLGWLLVSQGFGDSRIQGFGDSGLESQSKMKQVVGLVKERMNFLTDFWDQSYFFFEAPTVYDAKMVKKAWKEATGERMGKIIEIIREVEGSGLKAQDYEDGIKAWITEEDIGMGLVMNPLRLSLVGAPKGPGVFDIMEVLGKEEVINRIQKAITILG
ncbi:MAG: glutamate--tRNA ligase [Bacteroidales bacterium]|nr:glutamate--tRNA ligase [Bacteroidales bacterium]